MQSLSLEMESNMLSREKYTILMDMGFKCASNKSCVRPGAAGGKVGEWGACVALSMANDLRCTQAAASYF